MCLVYTKHMNSTQHKRIVIIGPTASGKSAIAIALAHTYTGVVIGADSRQVYRHMDLGSGKEPGARCNLRARTCRALPRTLRTILARTPHLWHPYISDGIAHYMIDIVSPRTPYSVAQFVARAQSVLHACHTHSILPIICGGTHFWVQALVEQQIFAAVPPNTALRTRLSTRPATELLAHLAALDPIRAEAIRKNGEHFNRVRLIRAIEIATALGSVPSPPAPNPPDPNTTLILAVLPDQATLHKNIEHRLPPRLAAGMLDEVAALHEKYHVPWTQLERFGLEYKWCARYLQGHCDMETLMKNIISESKKFAKRQRTWIRRWERSGARIHPITTAAEAHTLTHAFLSS